MLFSRIKFKWLLTGLGLLAGVAYYHGYEWRREWDLRSGKARIIKSLFGFDYAISEEFETNVSNWLARDPEVQKWVEVASGGNDVFPSSISYTENGVQWMLNGLILLSLSESERANCRQLIATRILSTLESTGQINDTYHYCFRLSEALEAVDWFNMEKSRYEYLCKIIDDPWGF